MPCFGQNVFFFHLSQSAVKRFGIILFGCFPRYLARRSAATTSLGIAQTGSKISYPKPLCRRLRQAFCFYCFLFTLTALCKDERRASLHYIFNAPHGWSVTRSPPSTGICFYCFYSFFIYSDRPLQGRTARFFTPYLQRPSWVERHALPAVTRSLSAWLRCRLSSCLRVSWAEPSRSCRLPRL